MEHLLEANQGSLLTGLSDCLVHVILYDFLYFTVFNQRRVPAREEVDPCAVGYGC